MIKRTYWWRGTPNFGDVLAKAIIDNLTPHTAAWTPARAADLVVTGSIATMLPDGWRGTAVGIGWARPEPRDLSRARVLALRGTLSADVYGRPVEVLGDPGLLAPYLVKRAEPRFGLVTVAHWQDTQLRERYPDAAHVDVRDDPMTVLSVIGRADRVVSSSLHGIIVADAYGIERRWETFPLVQGGGFKFRDYGSVVGRFGPGEWQTAPRATVERVQRDLLSALSLVR